MNRKKRVLLVPIAGAALGCAGRFHRHFWQKSREEFLKEVRAEMAAFK